MPPTAPSAPLAPFRPAAALLAAYLAATVPLAARGAASTPAPAGTGALLLALAALLAAAAWTLWAARDGRPVPGAARALAAWLPLLAVPACYAALPLVAAGLGRTAVHDALVIGWEGALFGTSPVLTLSARWPAPALSELLHAGYLSYYALIYLPPAWLWWRAARDGAPARGFAVATWTVWLTFVACYAVFAWLPVQGPWYQWPAPATIPDGPVRGVVQALLQAGSSRGTAFPSSHVAVSVAQTVALSHVAPRLSALTALATALLAAGAVYGGFHYAVDVLAGAAAGALLGALGPRVHARLTRA